MKASSVQTGIHDIYWKNQRKNWGPSLHFSYTIRFDLENGGVRAMTMPGFTVRKNDDGHYRLWPPVHHSNSVATIYCGIITKDDEAAIMAYLEQAGLLANVGKNRPDPKSLLELDADLSPIMPPNVILG